MAGNLHGHTLRHAAANHVPGCAPSQIVEQHVAATGFRAGCLPAFTELDHRQAVIPMEDVVRQLRGVILFESASSFPAFEYLS